MELTYINFASAKNEREDCISMTSVISTGFTHP